MTTIIFGIVLGILVFLQICALCRMATHRQGATANKTLESVSKTVEWLRHETRISEDHESDLLMEIRRLRNDTLAKKDNMELVKAISSLAHGVSDNAYNVLKELIDSVDTNDIGKLTNAVRGAKFICSQYEKAQSAGL